MAMTNRPVTCNVCDQCGVAAEADHVKDPRCVTRKTHARFTDSLSISGWTGGVSAAVLMIPVGPSAVVLMVPVGLSAPGLAALAAGYCAQLANCFGAPLVGARGFLGFHPLLFGMEREPAAPAGSTLFTFQDIAEYTGPLGGSRSRHHGRNDPAQQHSR